MRLVTFRTRYGERLGAAIGEHVLDLHAACELRYRAQGHGKPAVAAAALCPPSMVEFLQGGEEALDLARGLVDEWKDRVASGPAVEWLDRGVVLPRAGLSLAAPVPRPGKILCLGLNYRDHAEEAGHKIPEVPIVFSKQLSCVIGPGEPIVLPPVSSQVDYEVEFAFVIGRRAKAVTESEALAHVAGYTIFHDVSARDYQLRTSQWHVGKSFDTFGPMGPWLVTRDEVPDPHALAVELRLNGRVMQKSNTRHLIFGVFALVAYLSRVMTLEPGDVVSTGTPGGVGLFMTPPRYLRPGDVCALEIERLGVLENPVVSATRGRSTISTPT